MKDYRVVARVKNNRILAAMEAAGYSSPFEMCKANPILHYPQLCSLINMKGAPVGKRGKWTELANNLASVLGLLPEQLFNARQMAGSAAAVIVREVDEGSFRLAAPLPLPALPSPEDGIAARVDIKRLMECLTPRQRIAIEMIYGVDGGGEATLADVGERLGVTGQRVRQIVATAMRKMRHSSRDVECTGRPLDNRGADQR